MFREMLKKSPRAELKHEQTLREASFHRTQGREHRGGGFPVPKKPASRKAFAGELLCRQGGADGLAALTHEDPS